MQLEGDDRFRLHEQRHGGAILPAAAAAPGRVRCGAGGGSRRPVLRRPALPLLGLRSGCHPIGLPEQWTRRRIRVELLVWKWIRGHEPCREQLVRDGLLSRARARSTGAEVAVARPAPYRLNSDVEQPQQCCILCLLRPVWVASFHSCCFEL